MEVVAVEIDRGEFGVFDGDAGWICDFLTTERSLEFSVAIVEPPKHRLAVRL